MSIPRQSRPEFVKRTTVYYAIFSTVTCVFSLFQVKCGLGAMEIMVNWAEAEVTVVNRQNWWRNSRTNML